MIMPITVYKLTNIFQVTTAPVDPAAANAHTGGWSESYWTLSPFQTVVAQWNALTSARANLLPIQASSIGWRFQEYSMDKNFLTPKGTQAGPQRFPGRTGILTDLPQVALQIVTRSNAAPNRSNVVLRCMPDDQMTGGEYGPSPVFKGLVTTFQNLLSPATPGPVGFLGRDQSQASVRVLAGSGTDGITIDAVPATGLVVGDYVRFNRIHDSFGRPVIGSFRVTTINPGVPPGSAVITVAGWPSGVVVSKASGTLRRDQLAFFSYKDSRVRRAVVKKVGSPFEKYRGRRSKKRV
jgi:hypothetical protein